jgi:hypothetical protein
MRRDQLEHAIRTACQIVGHPAVAVVGSQAILGSFTEDELPPEATMSVEIDILPLTDDNDETARLADLIEGVAGEWCLDKEDLCVAKLCAFREKDQTFVAALLGARLVDAEVIAERLGAVPGKHTPAAERALGWLATRA